MGGSGKKKHYMVNFLKEGRVLTILRFKRGLVEKVGVGIFDGVDTSMHIMTKSIKLK